MGELWEWKSKWLSRKNVMGAVLTDPCAATLHTFLLQYDETLKINGGVLGSDQEHIEKECIKKRKGQIWFKILNYIL